MTTLRSLLVLGVVLGLTPWVQAQKDAKPASAPVAGVIKSIDLDKAGTGTITVQTLAGKKDGGAGEEKKIKVMAETKIEKIVPPADGQKPVKGAVPAGQAAKFSDLQANTRVMITLKNGSADVAEKILILPGQAKKAAK